MRFRYVGMLLLVGFAGSTGRAQEVTPSVLNIIRYGTGRSGGVAASGNFNYFEEQLDLRIGFPRSITAGMRFLYDAPPEIGPTFKGIKRRYVEFASDGLTIRAGNSSQLFGRGLALNLFEDRGLAYDTWMDGVKAGYEGSFFRATAVAGRVEYWDSIVVARTEVYVLKGANLEIDPFPWLTLGGSFVETEGSLPGILTPVGLKAGIPELYGSFRIGDFEGFGAWTQKRTTLASDGTTSSGYGVYGSLSWTGSAIGLVVDYKDYRFDIRDPFERYDPTRPTRMLPIQNPPTVQKEHSWTFLTRTLHQVDFNDEVGLQFEGFFKPAAQTTLTVNASLSSQHDYYDYQKDRFTFTRRARKGAFLPTVDAALSPSWELLAEAEHYFNDRDLLRAAVAGRAATQAVLFSRGNDHVIRSMVIPASLQIGLDDHHTVIVQVEFETASDNYNVARERYQNTLVGMNIVRLPGISLAVRSEFTNNPSDPSGRRNWFAGEVGYRLGGAHVFVLTVGQERGGQVCANGVCRYIQPFSGVRLAMQSTL